MWSLNFHPLFCFPGLSSDTVWYSDGPGEAVSASLPVGTVKLSHLDRAGKSFTVGTAASEWKIKVATQTEWDEWIEAINGATSSTGVTGKSLDDSFVEAVVASMGVDRERATAMKDDYSAAQKWEIVRQRRGSDAASSALGGHEPAYYINALGAKEVSAELARGIRVTVGTAALSWTKEFIALGGVPLTIKVTANFIFFFTLESANA